MIGYHKYNHPRWGLGCYPCPPEKPYIYGATCYKCPYGYGLDDGYDPSGSSCVCADGYRQYDQVSYLYCRSRCYSYAYWENSQCHLRCPKNTEGWSYSKKKCVLCKGGQTGFIGRCVCYAHQGWNGSRCINECNAGVQNWSETQEQCFPGCNWDTEVWRDPRCVPRPVWPNSGL